MNPLHGNAIVGQSGGPTAAINATLAGVIRGALDEIAAGGAIARLYGMRNGVDGLLREDIVELDKLFSEDTAALDRLTLTPAAALGSCRKKLPAEGAKEEAEIMGKLFAVFEKYDIRYFFYIGGNDSMDTVAKVSAYAKRVGYDMRVMGVPKTIDNDLKGTDHTREYVPLLILGQQVKAGNLGTRKCFADIAATVAQLLGVSLETPGESFAKEILL